LNDQQELRQTLADHEVLAPDSTGLLEAAQQGAGRVRRRRKMAYAAGAAVALAAVVAVAPTAAGYIGRPTASDSAASATPAYRTPLQVTVNLDESAGRFKLEYGIVGGTQFIVVRSSNTAPGGSGTILVHDPGTFDSSSLENGEPITIGGHRAYFVPAMEPGGWPAIGWQDPSGAWVIVAGIGRPEQVRAGLTQIAEAVRLGEPRDALVPYQLGYVPRRLPVTSLTISDYRPSETNVVTGFGGQPTLDSLLPTAVSRDMPLQIQVLPRSDYVDSHTPRTPPTKIAGYDSWYITTQGDVVPPPNGAILLVSVNNCSVQIQTGNRDQIPYQELKKLVERATFADCTDPGSWLPPRP
jgi:hypothetical protein